MLPIKTVTRGVKGTCNALEKWAYATGVRSVKSLTLPDFLGIGAQKAGTTWLDHQLRHHPDLFLPGRKEVHYFDRDFYRRLTHYARYFRGAGERVKGEITPAYGVLPIERIQFIHAILPDAKLIFLMRNPVDRAWSHAQMSLLNRAGRKIDEVSDERVMFQFKRRGAMLRGHYTTILDNWLSVYPKEQLYVGLFDDVVRQPEKLLTEVFTHLGVRTDVDWDAFPMRQVVHKGVGRPMPERFRAHLEEVYAPEIERLYERFGERVAHWRPGARAASG